MIEKRTFDSESLEVSELSATLFSSVSMESVAWSFDSDFAS